MPSYAPVEVKRYVLLSSTEHAQTVGVHELQTSKQLERFLVCRCLDELVVHIRSSLALRFQDEQFGRPLPPRVQYMRSVWKQLPSEQKPRADTNDLSTRVDAADTWTSVSALDLAVHVRECCRFNFSFFSCVGCQGALGP